MDKFHHILCREYQQWSEIEQQIEELPSVQEKGEVFEQFVYAYLSLNSDYYQIKNLYRSDDIPTEVRKKLKLEPTDYGVDGVFILLDGTIAAYQAKFRNARGSTTIRELATFWSEASRADYKYVISNATILPRQAGKHGYSVLADKFDELGSDFFALLHALTNEDYVKSFVRALPDAHQERMIQKTINGFQNSDRGKLIAACGAGKTLISLWIIEAMRAKDVLILVPSLALIKQTLEAWSKHKKDKFSYLCVCSDNSVIDAKELDYGEYEVSEIDFPVTTSSEKIKQFMNSTAKRKYIFSTYNSAQAISDAVDRKYFDLIIFDEAHRTAGQKDSGLYSVALNDETIPAKKRLFMTATERLIQPWVINKAEEEDRTVFSMDDPTIYGELFDRYTFGEAIQDGIIADYKILLTVIKAREVKTLIQENRLMIAEGDDEERYLTAQNIYKQTVLHKAMKDFNLKKIITFHSSVKRAKIFINGSTNETYGLEDLYKIIDPEIAAQELYFDWVDGTMPAGLRKQKLKEFEASNLGIISNARCLTEGVDVPIIDSIYFVDSKTSLIDIVQACGRALRKPRSDSFSRKVAYFIVPIVIHENESADQLDTGKFETLLNVIQALRNQDERLADWIDKINLGHVTGESEVNDRGDTGPMVIDFPQELNLSVFTNQIQVRIFEGVKGPVRQSTDLSYKVRKSNYRKVFKGLGDYSYNSYIENLVNPTIERFTSPEQILSKGDIKLAHNNVSHTLRLGLIYKDKSGLYHLTEGGKSYYRKQIDSEDVFKKAMLSFNATVGEKALYPYRAALFILTRVQSVNKIEFLYGIYSLQDSSYDSIEQAVNRISIIKKEYPKVLLVNDANKEVVLNELNKKFDENFSVADLWASTTATNKYIYFKNHLLLFDGIMTTKSEIFLKKEMAQKILDLLESTEKVSIA